MKKISEIRAESNEHLDYRKDELESMLFQLNNELARSHKLEKPHLKKEYKKEKARIMTVLSERTQEGR